MADDVFARGLAEFDRAAKREVDFATAYANVVQQQERLRQQNEMVGIAKQTFSDVTLPQARRLQQEFEGFQMPSWAPKLEGLNQTTRSLTLGNNDTESIINAKNAWNLYNLGGDASAAAFQNNSALLRGKLDSLSSLGGGDPIKGAAALNNLDIAYGATANAAIMNDMARRMAKQQQATQGDTGINYRPSVATGETDAINGSGVATGALAASNVQSPIQAAAQQWAAMPTENLQANNKYYSDLLATYTKRFAELKQTSMYNPQASGDLKLLGETISTLNQQLAPYQAELARRMQTTQEQQAAAQATAAKQAQWERVFGAGR